MPSANSEINHVSDTALMVAACRALESESPDGFVQDPFADRLAGERGRAILAAQPGAVILRFGVGVRSRFIDDLLREGLATRPIATVLSFGCGLDTRPWRLDLPPELRWIEVDFADMLDYKEGLLRDEKPRCRRERIAADLNDAAQRRAVFAAAAPGPSLLITEGLLMYLPAASVDALAAEAFDHGGVALWISDITTSAFSRAIGQDRMRAVRHVQAADSLAGEQIMDALRRHGWATALRRSYVSDMAFATERVRRLLGDRPQAEAPSPVSPDDPSGVQCFARAATAV